MTLHIVLDDSTLLSPTLRGLVGVERFSALVFQRSSRLDYMRTAAASAGSHLIVLSTKDDHRKLREKIRETGNGEHAWLFCPSNLVPSVPRDALVTFLRQLIYSPMSLVVPFDGSTDRRGWVLLNSAQSISYLTKTIDNDLIGFFESAADILVEVRDRIPLIDLSDERTLLEFMSGQFEARHFNSISHDTYTVTKRSTDRTKLRQEFDYYRFMPPEVQMFLVQPFDFRDEGDVASYRMERISVPDMALQWVHGAITEDEFRKFLAHVFHFIGIRPSRSARIEELQRAQKSLYLDKVESRIVQLKQLPDYEKLAPLFEAAFGGIDTLVSRYRILHGKMGGRFEKTRLVAGHGDPCFSNILYAKSNQYLKLIDPRGASDEEGLYTDPYYDVAKLSHSILGHYDFLNLGKFDLGIGDDLRLGFCIHDKPSPWAAETFRVALADAGFDLKLTRLCEASLFISMLPLHIDRPRNVLAFAINANLILTELENWKEGRS